MEANYESYAAMLEEPEKNGFRLVLKSFGPQALGKPQNSSNFEKIPWESLSTHKDSRVWWETEWVPVCEKLHLDPKQKPENPGFTGFCDSCDFCEFIQLNGIRGDEPFRKDVPFLRGKDVRISEEDAKNYSQKLLNELWNPSENPQAAAWLEGRKMWFERYAQGVKYPIFVSFYPATGLNEGDTPNLSSTILNDAVENRGFSCAIIMRINSEICTDEIETAIDDILTLFRLARHQGTGMKCFVTRLIGNAIESEANEAVQALLKSGKASESQLVRLESEIRTISSRSDDASVFDGEMLMVYDAVQLFFRRDPSIRELFSVSRWFPLLFDENRVRVLFAKDVQQFRDAFLEKEPYARKEKMDAWEKYAATDFSNHYVRYLVTIQGRSRLGARWLQQTLLNFEPMVLESFSFRQAQTPLSLVAIAIERFRLKNGHLPEALDALVPDFLPEKPLDPCTQRDTLVYRISEDQNSFLLYSLGPNLKDDGGDAEEMRDVVFPIPPFKS